MPDIVDGQTRSRMMSGIRGKDTKPELLCGWFDKNNVFHKDYFPAQILSKVVLSNN